MSPEIQVQRWADHSTFSNYVGTWLKGRCNAGHVAGSSSSDEEDVGAARTDEGQRKPLCLNLAWMSGTVNRLMDTFSSCTASGHWSTILQYVCTPWLIHIYTYDAESVECTSQMTKPGTRQIRAVTVFFNGREARRGRGNTRKRGEEELMHKALGCLDASPQP